MRVVEEEIFAVAYYVVRRETAYAFHAPRVRHAASLRGQARVKSKHLAFGEESDEEEVKDADEHSASSGRFRVVAVDDELLSDPSGWEY